MLKLNLLSILWLYGLEIGEIVLSDRIAEVMMHWNLYALKWREYLQLSTYELSAHTESSFWTPLSD